MTNLGKLAFFIALTLNTACSETARKDPPETELEDENPVELVQEIQNAPKQQPTTSTPEPHLLLNQSLIADFNGDGWEDTALFLTKAGKAGIEITDGQTNEIIRIGMGVQFDKVGDDFSWVDHWSITRESTTFEIVIVDGEVQGDTLVQLSYPSILLSQEEVGGGLITFRNGKYEWIHQADKEEYCRKLRNLLIRKLNQ